MADQYQHHSAAAEGMRMQKNPAPGRAIRGTQTDLHTSKSGGVDTFVPPPMETITGKRMMQGTTEKFRPEPVAPPQYAGKYTPDAGSVNSFVPPSIKMITGESVMPMESPEMPMEGLGMPLAPSPSAAPESVQNPYYAAGFLKNYIGRDMQVQFLLGGNGALVDRTGTLMEVGASYIVLKPTGTDDLLMCDLYAIKFVTIYR